MLTDRPPSDKEPPFRLVTVGGEGLQPGVEALAFARELVRRPRARLVGPGPRHWELVTELCRDAQATGKLVADAQHAAVAIEHGCTFVTTDSDCARFPRLRWQHALAAE